MGTQSGKKRKLLPLSKELKNEWIKFISKNKGLLDTCILA
jgi:hypothetical protein